MGKFLDAAEIVLRRGGEPMIVSKLTEQALSDRLLDGCNGDTPIQTMKAKLSVDIKVNGPRSRFKRIGPGSLPFGTLLEMSMWHGLFRNNYGRRRVFLFSQLDSLDRQVGFTE